jgi:hypothetical protein
MKTLLGLATAAALSSLLFACASTQPGNDGSNCVGSKCDDPGSTADSECRNQCGSDTDCFDECRTGQALLHCEARRSDALLSSQRAFTKDAIRWACADVEGVNTNGKDDRGQEYCEYFAVVQPPPKVEGGQPVPAEDLGRNLGFGATPLSLDLTDDQIFALEDEPDAVAGQCIFSSWHQDVRGPLPSCENGSCPEITVPDDQTAASWMSDKGFGFELDEELMKMKISINSNSAAADLVERCLVTPEGGDPDDANDPLHDNFIRGCMTTFELFTTEWRRSDPSVCVASMRLAECGCGVDTDGDGVADITDIAEISRAVVPRQPQPEGITLRGFSLGTWSGANELPAGCRYLDTGDDSQTAVACNLTASDVLASLQDPKGRCREKYGDNVVVHVPVPAEAIVCSPPTDGSYTNTCGAMPWVVGAEGDAPDEGGECCRTCVTSQACGDSCIPMTSTCTKEPGCACQG